MEYAITAMEFILSLLFNPVIGFGVIGYLGNKIGWKVSTFWWLLIAWTVVFIMFMFIII